MNLRGKLVNENYIPRVLDRRIFEDMHDLGAACIEGFGAYAYQREDGVFVIPIICLAP